MGPNYANFFVGFIEELIFQQYSGPKPEFFGRYIDDCSGATIKLIIVLVLQQT